MEIETDLLENASEYHASVQFQLHAVIHMTNRNE